MRTQYGHGQAYRDLREACGASLQGNRIHYDGEITGFGLRVTPRGSKSFILNYRFNGQERRYTIGPFPEFSVQTARDRAYGLRQAISNGEDPFTLKEARQREAVESQARLRTLKELATEYLERHANVHKRPKSIREDRTMLAGVILPQLGQIRVAHIYRRETSNLHASLKATPYRANRVLALLRKMFNFAISDNEREWGNVKSRLWSAEVPRGKTLPMAFRGRVGATLGGDEDLSKQARSTGRRFTEAAGVCPLRSVARRQCDTADHGDRRS
jgi:hypothetical protein